MNKPFLNECDEISGQPTLKVKAYSLMDTFFTNISYLKKHFQINEGIRDSLLGHHMGHMYLKALRIQKALTLPVIKKSIYFYHLVGNMLN